MNRSGYAQATQDYVWALKRSDCYNLHLTILHSTPEQTSVSPERYRELLRLMNNPLDDETFIQVFHCIPEMQKRANRGGRGVAFGTFETTDPPEEWVKILNTNEAIICPSNFCEQSFRTAGITKPIFTIPHVIDTSLYHPGVEPLKKQDRFTFLFFATWKRRKGWRELFEAWYREFKRSDGVQILVKTDRLSQSMREIADIRKNLGVSEEEAAPVLYETRILNEVELPKLFKSADCLICPTYGEGFGLPGLQSMAVGVPIIITDYSGCQEYANEETATLLKPEGSILYNDMDGIPQFRNKRWAHVSVESVRSAMRYVLGNTDIVNKKAERALRLVSEKFHYGRAVEGFDRMLEALDE
jgi:glycosyltransferase involved in cell wall biosynthesis